MEKMMSVVSLQKRLMAGEMDERLQRFYGVTGEALMPCRTRILEAATRFTEIYGDCPVRVFSVPGRTELGGNHTDHQHGCVLAGGISLDIIAVAAYAETETVQIYSEGFGVDTVALNDLRVHPEEAGTSAALIRGMAARFAALGKPVGGMVAYTTSSVLKGSGLSSSAAFEVMIGLMCNELFADGMFSLPEIAMMAQYAENEYFGKPCGLMDQMACALGTVTAMDFADADAPQYEQIPLDLGAQGYALCIIDSGADHADLTDEYAAIPAEMKCIARALGAAVLRDTDEAAFWANIPSLRQQCGDRAVMRAIHFYGENARAQQEAAALRQGDFDGYLKLVMDSGRSSVFALQNISAAGSKECQAVAVALALCEKLLAGKGAYRVHGGGFAGTVQAYVPLEMVPDFQRGMDAALGEGACKVLQLRIEPAAALWEGDNVCC